MEGGGSANTRYATGRPLA